MKGGIKAHQLVIYVEDNVKSHPLYPTGKMIENGFRSLFRTSKACLSPAGKYCSFESIVSAWLGKAKLIFMCTGLVPLSAP